MSEYRGDAYESGFDDSARYGVVRLNAGYAVVDKHADPASMRRYVSRWGSSAAAHDDADRLNAEGGAR